MVAVLHEIHAPVFRRIDAQFFCHDVGLAFTGKGTLRVARRAHVSARKFIGVNVFLFDVGVGNPVRPRGFMGAHEKTLGSISAISAAVENIFHLLGDQQPVFFHTGFDLDRCAVAWIAGDQLLGIINEEFHRAATFLRQHIAKSDFVGIALAAEIPPDITRMNHDIRGGNLQRAAHLLAHGERALG